VHLLGFGLHADLLPGYLQAVQEEADAQGHALDSWPPDGVLDLVRRGEPLEAGGNPLGYEALDVHPSEQRHSWLCHGLEREMHERFGIRPGAFGLLRSQEDACRVATVCGEGGGEPGVWRAWRIVEYPLAG
jgi:hypothetical protein